MFIKVNENQLMQLMFHVRFKVLLAVSDSLLRYSAV
jgi:hypothetical protein